jgi:hypothetical protein
MTESDSSHGERKRPVLSFTVAPAHVIAEIKRTEIKPETANAVMSYQPLFLGIMAASVLFAITLEIVLSAIIPEALLVQFRALLIVPLLAGFAMAFFPLTALFRSRIQFPAHECQWILNQNICVSSKARLRTEGEMAPLYLELAEPFVGSKGGAEISRMAIFDNGTWRRTPSIFSGKMPLGTQYEPGKLGDMNAITKVYKQGAGPWVDVTIYIDPRSGNPYIVRCADGLMLVKR